MTLLWLWMFYMVLLTHKYPASLPVRVRQFSRWIKSIQDFGKIPLYNMLLVKKPTFLLPGTRGSNQGTH